MARKLKPWEIFQNEFYSSFGKDINVDRINDGFTRTSNKVVADYVGFNGDIQVYFELKRCGIDEYVTAERLSQTDMMFAKSKYKHVESVFVIRFDERDETFWLPSYFVKGLLDSGVKKLSYDVIKNQGQKVYSKYTNKGTNVYDIETLFYDISLPF